ncbi:MAG: ATP-binding protein [Methanoculleus horonobensis]|jgi:PAS domain S-box-containing protein|uniref:histidine kinase n=2 Tax=Methanoculleus TaxID=45989 RepID=A3CVG3_METMJ|nr:multi-sensor signal transduction histidine kinase [Methanoculleus marisnigri JR1]MDD3070362.1 ATP-binding protein [Methanoculleus horonobensis]
MRLIEDYAESMPWSDLTRPEIRRIGCVAHLYPGGVSLTSYSRRSAIRDTRLLLVAASVLVAFIANAAGLLAGVTIVLPHLLYLPIVLAAYWFPRRGILFSLALALGYLALALPFTGGEAGAVVSALSRAVVFAAVGTVVSFLSLRLREQEERYRGIFDNSEAGTFIIAPGESGPQIEETNYVGAALLGFTTKDLVGKHVAGFFEDPEAWETLAADIDRSGTLYDYETVLLRIDGTAVQVLVSAGRLPGERIVLTLVDITARKNAEDALRRTNAKLNMLGHLTRSDLAAAVSGLLERIAGGMREFDDPGIHRYLRSLEEDARVVQRRAEITRDYQDLGLRPSGWQPVQKVIWEVTSRLVLPGISVRSWVERLEVFADPMLDRVFSNLLENAARHGKTVSSVVITYRILDDGLVISIEDDGVGIPEAEKEQIFDYGVGIEGGLGLFLVREILAITNMTIRETGTPGRGARFEIHVPPAGYRII